MSDIFQQLDPDLAQALEALMEAMGEDVRVGIPGIVQHVESTNPPRVTVLPAVGRYGVSSADPGVPGVRWGTMASGGATVALPVTVGDPCWLLVADRELDGWMAKDGASSVTAQDPRTHDLADCVAVPMDIGILPAGAAGNFWAGGSTVTSILEGAAIKLGALATQAVIRGNIYNAAHGIMIGVVASGFTGLAAFFGGVLTVTATFKASPKNLSDVATWILAVGDGAGSLAGVAQPLCTAAATAITTVFIPAQSTWLSTKVSTE